jgi:hypothetical protein
MKKEYIKKALACCIEKQCKDCPLRIEGRTCDIRLLTELLVFINCQEAKIDKLEKYNKNLLATNTALLKEKGVK